MPAIIRNAVLISSICLTNLITLNSCDGEKRNKESHIESYITEDEKWLKGKHLCCIDSIIEQRSKNEIIYIFNFYDCITCIDKGFKAVHNIDSVFGKSTVKVIVSMFQEITTTQRQNNYKGLIYKDTKDRIRKELKYAPTPALLIIDDSCQIQDAFIFDTSNNRERQLDKFINKCISILKSNKVS